jgi:hypothetical protein
VGPADEIECVCQYDLPSGILGESLIFYAQHSRYIGFPQRVNNNDYLPRFMVDRAWVSDFLQPLISKTRAAEGSECFFCDSSNPFLIILARTFGT